MGCEIVILRMILPQANCKERFVYSQPLSLITETLLDLLAFFNLLSSKSSLQEIYVSHVYSFNKFIFTTRILHGEHMGYNLCECDSQHELGQ